MHNSQAQPQNQLEIWKKAFSSLSTELYHKLQMYYKPFNDLASHLCVDLGSVVLMCMDIIDDFFIAVTELFIRPKRNIFLFPVTRPTVKKPADRKNFMSFFTK